jgi:hypothetical protein
VYGNIRKLRDADDAQHRGYAFEQLMREIVPWDFRPPIAINAVREQLDAFFEWNGWHFHLEAKAKKGPITGGSHDWEDFELKVRKRPGVVGLFCSLYPVGESLLTAADELAANGFATIVIEGETWDQLDANDLDFSVFLRFMVGYARSHRQAIPPSIDELSKLLIDRDQIRSELKSKCVAESATFLRRHRLEFHDSVYIKRYVDEQIREKVKSLTPSRLRSKSRLHKRSGTDIGRSRYPQIIIARDAAGAGKTTLSVDLASPGSEVLAIAQAAVEPDIDKTIDFLRTQGDDYGLSKLIQIDEPLLLVIDSLDEALHLPHKQREIVSLLRLVQKDKESKLKDLNEIAAEAGLLQFPIIMLFTVRDEYWERWVTVFESRPTIPFKSVFSQFEKDELEIAIAAYEKAFAFNLVGELTPTLRETLSIPFTLRVFAEAHQFNGPIEAADAFPEKVLHLYFQRKAMDAAKRGVPGFLQEQFMEVSAAIAERMLLHKTNELRPTDIDEVVEQATPLLRGSKNEVVLALVSDRILQRRWDIDKLGFRHARFMEFLVAWRAVSRAQRGEGLKFLDDYVAAMIEHPYLSAFRVHDLVRYLATQGGPKVVALFEDYYSRSAQFLELNVGRMRAAIRSGSATPQRDLEQIMKTVDNASPVILWENFFVLAAAANAQASHVIVGAFQAAWIANIDNSERWKLIEKVRDRGMLPNEDIWAFASRDASPREAEALLGRLLEDGEREAAAAAANLLLARITGPHPKWEHSQKLIDIAMSDKPYILGDLI